jgi:hypothetical protein
LKSKEDELTALRDGAPGSHADAIADTMSSDGDTVPDVDLSKIDAQVRMVFFFSLLPRWKAGKPIVLPFASREPHAPGTEHYVSSVFERVDAALGNRMTLHVNRLHALKKFKGRRRGREDWTIGWLDGMDGRCDKTTMLNHVLFTNRLHSHTLLK